MKQAMKRIGAAIRNIAGIRPTRKLKVDADNRVYIAPEDVPETRHLSAKVRSKHYGSKRGQGRGSFRPAGSKIG